MADRDSSPPLTARLLDGVRAVDAAHWDALAGTDDPFLSHAFLALLEESGSVGPGSGWTPATLLVDAPHKGGASTSSVVAAPPLAALPAYLKTHSQGEYVFDHGWAEAWENAGGRYYPKLQIAVPFTPVPGRRLLGTSDDGARAAIAAAEALVQQNGLSSAHATFVAAGQLPLFDSADWLIRTGSQFHWANRDYAGFDDFLAQLSSRKRKTIRHERSVANAAVSIAALTGDAIRPHHWDAMWVFYQDTGARKWGQPYLTRAAFGLMGERMADKLLLIIADIDGVPVAGALNVIGGDALYGRYWGCTANIPCLHFELCYYQAIEFAIAHGLARVEAGAQGEHKLARGYLPVPTYSAHYLPDPGFRRAVADYLVRETRGVEQERGWLGQHSPFKEGY